MASLGIRKSLQMGFKEALPRVIEALKGEGFGVLTEIDVQQTLADKIGVEFRPYKILGACNPPLAHRALSANLEIGVMLPCNVVVYEDDESRAVVLAVDPLQTIATAQQPALNDVATEVRQRLLRVMDRLE